MGRRKRSGELTGPEAKAVERYRELRRRGRPSPPALDGPRIRAKVDQGWQGARFRAFFLGAGILLCAGGGLMIAAAVVLTDRGESVHASLGVRGAVVVGFGVLVLIGHPVKVLLARRRWKRLLATEGEGKGKDGNEES
ncbi:hypothetical protein [Streptomyces sp. NPDC057552]|uniref:hypothetical protein n=1 Tax=Streptomyces sp. NPDC057552 TaxID=3350537 RepID=UPI0036B57275